MRERIEINGTIEVYLESNNQAERVRYQKKNELNEIKSVKDHSFSDKTGHLTKPIRLNTHFIAQHPFFSLLLLRFQ